MFSLDELLGMTILQPVDDELIRAKVVRKIMDRDTENHQQDFIYARTLPIYKCHMRFKF